MLTVAMALAAAGLFYVSSNDRLTELGRRNLDGELALEAAELEATMLELTHDLQLMAHTPPIQGLVRAERGGGVDPMDGSTIAQWRARLTVLFSELLRNKPAYLQARYIRGDEQAMELLRVDRPAVGEPFQAVPLEELQSKAHAPYVRATLARPPEDVYVSELNYNREYGRIQEPRIPVIRAAVPVHTPQTPEPYGLVVLNLDARPLLEALKVLPSSHQTLYAVNGDGHYVLHPTPGVAFSHDPGDPPAVAPDFPRILDVLEHRSDGRAQVMGDQVVAMQRVPLSSDPDGSAVGLIIVQPVDSLIQTNVDALRGLAPLFVILTLFGLVLGTLLARQAVRPMVELATAVRGMDMDKRRLDRPRGLTGEAAALADSLEHAVTSLRAADRVEANNRELRQFVYVASHDLQEPLRTITTFASVLDEDYRDRLDDDGRKALGFIQRSASRMSALITSLLEHGRLGSNTVLERTDLNALFADVREDLGAQLVATGATVAVGDLGTMAVFPAEVRLLFQNLVSNSLKFYQGTGVPQVRITSEPAPHGRRFQVCDNGPGIPEGQRENVFMMFRRLHRRTEIEGTGIGLANCRKVVEMHGGDIRATESPLGGACIEFTLQQPDEG